MKFNYMLSGLLLCGFASLVLAADQDIYQLQDELIWKEVQTGAEQAHARNVEVNMDDELGDEKHALVEIAHGEQRELQTSEASPSSDNREEKIESVPANELNTPVVAPAPADEPAPVKESVSNEPVESKLINTSVVENDNGWSSLPSLKEYGKQQLVALSAGAVILGYAVYKSYQFLATWVKPIVNELQQNIAITVQDRDVLLGLVKVMMQDVQNLRDGKHESSLVAQYDLTGLSEVIADECNFIRDNFVELYNIIEPSGVNIDVLIMFYEEFDRATQALIAQATIA